jgi:hypothetical protein
MCGICVERVRVGLDLEKRRQRRREGRCRRAGVTEARISSHSGCNVVCIGGKVRRESTG